MKTTNKYCRLPKSSGFWEGAKIRPENLVKLALRARSKIGQVGMILTAIGGAIFSGNNAIAQINPDNTLGAESSVVTPNVDIKGVLSDRIDGGATRGAQLFHSFSEFNVNNGRGAYFSNPTGIESIFSRVTGNNASNIAGKLGVLGNANLFLLNPNGIIFGPNASLDLGGSFLASTANSFNFGDGKEFSATNPTGAPLLAVTVPLGVQFNQAQPNAIANSGNLAVSTGQNLTLLGGTVASTGNLSAPFGQIAVAAVPGGSVVNLNSSGQLLNIDTSSTAGNSSQTKSSLAKLLTENNQISLPELTVKSDGNVELAGSGLSVGDGDVVAKNVSAQTATLTAQQNLTLVESQLNTTGDLNLLAGDTVRVRDTVANPFVAQAGGKLLVQGKQGVDIFALNNSSSGLVSGGDMILRSANTVGGDAHYWAGGSFRIEQMDSSLGGLFSPDDPIIRAAGDVSFDSYEGASLHILAGGSVTIAGNVNITGAETNPANGLVETVPLSQTLPDGTSSVEINGVAFPTLDIRAGVHADAIGIPGLTPDPIPGIVNPTDSSQPTSANIEIGNIYNLSGKQSNTGQILITNQYNPNALPGSIETGLISTYSDVDIDSRGDITTNGEIFTEIGKDTTSDNRIAGDIRLIADGKIKIGGSLLSQISEGNGVAGNITLKARGDITAGDTEKPVNIISTSNSNSNDQGFSIIRLESSQGSVFLDKVKLSTTNTGSNYAGDIRINAAEGKIEITNSPENDEQGKYLGLGIISNGYFGIIDINAGNNVSITNANLTAQTPSNLPEPSISTNSGNINITSKNGNIEINNSFLTTLTQVSFDDDSKRINGGNIDIRATSVSLTGGAQLSASTFGKGDAGSIFLSAKDSVSLAGTGTTVFSNVEAGGEGNGGNIDIRAASVSLTGGAQLQTVTKGIGNAGNIKIHDTDTVQFDGSTAFSTVEDGGVGNAGTIDISAASLSLTNGAQLQTLIRQGQDGKPAGQGGKEPGKININVTGEVKIEGQGSLINSDVQPGAKGDAGEIVITSGSLSITNGAQVSTSTSGEGNAGSVVVFAPKVVVSGTATNDQLRDFSDTTKLSEGIFAKADQEKGIAGAIGILTNELRVEKGAEITVSSPKGQAGNLTILAKKVLLNNGAFIATTGETVENQKDGGNIILLSDPVVINTLFQLLQNPESVDENTLNELNNRIEKLDSALLSLIAEEKLRGEVLPGSPLDFLLMGNESRIAANAGNNADGGNVAINTRLLIVLPPTGKNGSDITANAQGGKGGVVAIKAEPLGIYGTEFRKQATDNTNDITASSEQGSAGIVSLAIPNVDPSKGLIQLPEELGDSSKLIAQSCPVGGQQASSQFVVTGRGGLPPSPDSALNSDVLVGNAAANNPAQSSFPDSASVATVEAQGVNIGPNGEILLTANPTKLASYSSWQRFTSCNAK
ncbi:filamentous hemagglutinin N-terminal domain-containing protein [Cylindrospermum stagnale]|nr:filamentous hemagglutinin N-terminal domain-containing protein [Cylindrospermum stagnale]